MGVTGAVDAVGVILDGLRRLEYRGYDSAGIVLVEGTGSSGGGGPARLWRARQAGGTKSVARLAEEVSGAPADATAGLGHVRWATHGRPTAANAHPHLDCTGRLAIVHNGIIENHLELSAELRQAGHAFSSETDTEVVAHLLEEALASVPPGSGSGPGPSALAVAVRAALSRVEGAFALAVVHDGEPDLLVGARRVSPLIVGITEDGGLLASDIPALLGRTRHLYALEDDQVVEVRPGSLQVTDLGGRPVEPRPLRVDWDLEAAEKGGYDDFMAKEIHEQPLAVRETLLGRHLPDGSLMLDEMRLSGAELRDVDKVFIVGCGSSYHAAMVAKYAIEHWARLPVEIDIASEFRYRDPVLDRRTLVIGISQSGETVDTLQALRSAHRCGSKGLVVTNVVDSSMARESDAVLYTRAGPEIGVASTKTHLAQIVALEVLALYLGQLRGTLSPDAIAELLDAMRALPDQLEEVLRRGPDVARVAEGVAGARDFFYLGRHVGYPVALEGALKLKELSYLRAEGYPAGELKHGPIALIEPGTVVVGVATRTRLWEKLMSNLAEVKARGATVVLVVNDGDEETAAQADAVCPVPRTRPLFSPVLDVVPLQFLAYHLARSRGLDVDRPRNLAKVVTVE